MRFRRPAGPKNAAPAEFARPEPHYGQKCEIERRGASSVLGARNRGLAFGDRAGILAQEIERSGFLRG